jgi:hypothetical protein
MAGGTAAVEPGDGGTAPRTSHTGGGCALAPVRGSSTLALPALALATLLRKRRAAQRESRSLKLSTSTYRRHSSDKPNTRVRAG